MSDKRKSVIVSIWHKLFWQKALKTVVKWSEKLLYWLQETQHTVLFVSKCFLCCFIIPRLTLLSLQEYNCWQYIFQSLCQICNTYLQCYCRRTGHMYIVTYTNIIKSSSFKLKWSVYVLPITCQDVHPNYCSKHDSRQIAWLFTSSKQFS